MPSKHRYKCLNYDRCRSYKHKSLTPMFVAMNSPQPTCPHCGSIKLEDGGEAFSFSVMSGSTRQTDTSMREIAEIHGMTDMSNKGGKGPKAVTGEAKGDFGKINVNGVAVPVDHNPTCSRINLSSKLSVKPGENAKMGPKANVLQAHGAPV